MGNTVCIILNNYIGNGINLSRTVVFHILRECLNEYLEAMEDDRDIEVFLNTYDSDEAEMAYRYAADDVRIIKEQISYCSEFEKAYENYVKSLQSL